MVQLLDHITTELATLLVSTKATEERKSIASTTAASISRNESVDLAALCKQIADAITCTSSADARINGCLAIEAICPVLGARCEPYVIPLLAGILDLYADKKIPVRAPAETAAKAVIATVSPNAFPLVLLQLITSLQSTKKWQTKTAALELLTALTNSAPQQVALSLSDIIPVLSEVMWDTRADVKKSAEVAMIAGCSVCGNPDIIPFVPSLITCIRDPSKIPECVRELSATTFVTRVESPALAVMAPLLIRGLNNNATAVKRQSAVIIDNMCKLVEEPREAAVFLPKLKPGLEKTIDVVSDPECRDVATRAYKTLLLAGGGGEVDAKQIVFEDVHAAVKKAAPEVVDEQSVAYIAGVAQFLIGKKEFGQDKWTEVISKYWRPFVKSEKMQAVAKEVLDKCFRDCSETEPVAQYEEEDGDDLCNCEFSLAYGGMILLSNTRLRLKKGKRYGLVGQNGCGKSTLMRAINNGQLDGFPTKEELKTTFVEHNLQAESADLPVVDFLCADTDLQGLNREEIVKTLADVGFSPEMQAKAVGALSGGWKMKLELCRGVLSKAHIFLLDEPTNHLDQYHVAWLEKYLKGLKDVTSLIVSHDSGFLDNVCTGIIHYENRKLKMYKGNLKDFASRKPEAKVYYTLAPSDELKFTFPEPGFLDDVKSKGRPICRLDKCSYMYPGTDKPSMMNATVSCSLSSRIGVTGPNGAGKSTLIKMLTGETEPSQGAVWRHPSLRFAYVAQHAFHHIEKHLDKSVNEYIQWRFQTGEDKELLMKASRQISPEEQKMMDKVIPWEGEKRKLEKIVSRRKLKKSFEYEVKWLNMNAEDNEWVSRDHLERWGFTKLIQKADDEAASKANLKARPLTQKSVQDHLDLFGLDAEFGTYNPLSGLSGGQKIKAILAAAFWPNPHIVVMDEPTNYLDRTALSALANAIKDFEGGVVVISHNPAFLKECCTETWSVAEGVVNRTGLVPEDKTKVVDKRQETTIDAFGNVVKHKIKRTLTRKERKARDKAKKEALANGEEWSSDEE